MRSLALLLCGLLLAALACGPRRDEARAMRARKAQSEVAREEGRVDAARVHSAPTPKRHLRNARISGNESELLAGETDLVDPLLAQALIDAAAGFQADTGLGLSADPFEEDQDIEAIFQAGADDVDAAIADWSPALGSLDAEDFAR